MGYTNPERGADETPGSGRSAFVPMRDASGRVTGMMDRTTADFLASRNGRPSQASLDALLPRMTRVRVTTLRYQALDGTMRGGDVLVDVNSPTAVDTFRRSLVIEEQDEAGHVMLIPEHYLELFAGETPLVTVGWIVPSILRWDEVWKGDAGLREPMALLDWMADQGRPELRTQFEERRREDEARWRQQAEAAARWLAAMPPCLKPWWESMRINSFDSEKYAAVRSAVDAAYPATADRIRTLFRWFGSGAGPWNGFPSYEAVPESLLMEYPTTQLVAALEATELGDAELEGAARLFASWTFRKRWRKDKRLVPAHLLERLKTHALTPQDDVDRCRRAAAAFGSP